ncbi:MAG: DUF3501 family protein [Rhodospirillales bacterium]|nr:DUF3501 family protein [Rhodospirillales bacterium]
MSRSVASKRAIARDDIRAVEAYAAERTTLRRDLVQKKKLRRLEVGPVATFYFENYETMWHQIHEMLYIEKGGEEQIADELAAYNPLIPQGRELVATVMFEIDDPKRRAAFLSKLGGVEETMFIEVAGEKIMSKPEADVDRTTADGKASSVQFVHFPMNEAAATAFKTPGTRSILGIDHVDYGHMVVIPEPIRAALAKDLD